jgi:hypothetical protein
MGSQPRRLAILSIVISSAIGFKCDASAEECDYKTCGALMARDASVSWAVSGQHDYSLDTKRACAEFNACVRRAKNNSARQSPAAQHAAPVTVGSSPATIGSTLRASCGPDVQRLCAGARRESEVLKCLDSQRMGLSMTCSLYFEKLGARPTAQGNASNKKPPFPPPSTQIPAQKKKPPSPSPTTLIPVQENAPSKHPLSSPPTAPIPSQENAPKEKLPSPPPITPIPVQENAPNKRPTPPAAPIPD